MKEPNSKKRRPENTLVQISMSRELEAKAKAFVKAREMPLATWVRTLILAEMSNAQRDARPQSWSAPAGAPVAPNTAQAGRRQCQGGGRKAVNC